VRAPIALTAALLAASPAAAQVDHDLRGWLNVNAQGRIAGRALFYAEVQPRVGDDLARLRQILLRPAIGYQLTPRVSVWQGYAHVENPQAGPDGPSEDRSYQQLTWIVPAGSRINLQSRTRLEQRWQSNGRDTGWRAREFVRAAFLPAANPKGVAPLVWSELFWALDDTDWGARSGFDQIRLFGGVDVPVSGKLRGEIGYLNQIVNQRAGRTAMNHVASLTLYWRP